MVRNISMLAATALASATLACGDGGGGSGEGGADAGTSPDADDGLTGELRVVTHVPETVLAAGERVRASCELQDATGAAVGDDEVADVSFLIAYDHPDSFSTDEADEVIAVRAGQAEVRCSVPRLDLVDESPVDLEIVPGSPVVVETELASNTAIAGEPTTVTCRAFDAYGNEVPDPSYSLATSPSGGVSVEGDAIVATRAEPHEVSCIVPGATEVDSDFLEVLPALPASLSASLSPERDAYAIGDQVSISPQARDEFGNRVDDATFSYAATPDVSSPSAGRFLFGEDGAFDLSVEVISETADDVELFESIPVIVNTTGPVIECMRADDPTEPSSAYMIEQAPDSTMLLPVAVADDFEVASVRIRGSQATLNPDLGVYERGVAVQFGMNFVDVVAEDEFGLENSTTCTFLASSHFSDESDHMSGALGLRLDPRAVSGGSPSDLDSINDILHLILSSDALVELVDQGLIDANPINDGGCGIFACEPEVEYNAGTIGWDTPTTTTSLIDGGLRVEVELPDVELTVRACGTTCCIGGSTIVVGADSIAASIDFSLGLEGGVPRAGVLGDPTVSVGDVSLDGSGFCGFLIDLLEGFFSGTVRDAIRDALGDFIESDVGPMLDELASSLDVSTLGQTFEVPRLDGSGTIDLDFGLEMSSLDVAAERFLLAIGTRFSPAISAHNRQSLGIARRTASPLLDPPTTSDDRPVGLSLYEGVLNQVLHGLWRAGFFEAELEFGDGTATIDSRLPAVVTVAGDNQARLMLGGIRATITIPGVIDDPLALTFGGLASAAVDLSGDAFTLTDLTLDDLFVSFDASLDQDQRNALEDFLTKILQGVLADAINEGLPAIPIPSFEIPEGAGDFGLPAGADLGLVDPRLDTGDHHYLLTGRFGIRD